MKTAFAISAHPDDIEFLMSGTLMLLGKAGYELHYMTVSSGNLGSTTDDSETTARIRREEAMAAAASIDAVFHESIAHDLDIFYDRDTLAKVAAVMRDVAPEILLTHSPVDYMEDHANTCRLAVTAAFARGMPNYQTRPDRQPTSQAVAVYHAQPYSNRDPLGQIVMPQFFVDVTDIEDDKVVMLQHHASQKLWLDQSQGIDSYLQALRSLDAQAGQMSGKFEYAEGWRRHLHLGFCGEKEDPLSAALRDRIVEVGA